MPSTKKRARSPEVHEPSSMRQSTSVQIHQYVPPKKRRYRGPKDDRLKALHKALHKLERRRRYPVFGYTADIPVIAHAHQLNTRVRHMAPAPVESSLQSSPELAVPHSPPSLPAEGGPESFNGPPVSPHVPLGSSLRATSYFRDNRALLRQTRHLDDPVRQCERKRKRSNQTEKEAEGRARPVGRSGLSGGSEREDRRSKTKNDAYSEYP